MFACFKSTRSTHLNHWKYEVVIPQFTVFPFHYIWIYTHHVSCVIKLYRIIHWIQHLIFCRVRRSLRRQRRLLVPVSWLTFWSASQWYFCYCFQSLFAGSCCISSSSSNSDYSLARIYLDSVQGFFWLAGTIYLMLCRMNICFQFWLMTVRGVFQSPQHASTILDQAISCFSKAPNFLQVTWHP